MFKKIPRKARTTYAGEFSLDIEIKSICKPSMCTAPAQSPNVLLKCQLCLGEKSV